MITGRPCEPYGVIPGTYTGTNQVPYWSVASASGVNPYSAAVAASITFPGAANVS